MQPLSLVASLLSFAFVACAHNEAQPTTPEPLEEPSPQSMPASRLDNFAERLTDARVLFVEHDERLVRNGAGEQVLVETMAAARMGETFVCRRLDGADTSCWSAPVAARRFLTWFSDSRALGIVSRLQLDIAEPQVRLFVELLPDGGLRATARNMSSSIRDPQQRAYEHFESVPVPALFDALRATQVLSSSPELLVRDGEDVVFCTRDEEVQTCSTPTTLAALSGRGRRINRFAHEYPTLLTVETEWAYVDDDVYRTGVGTEFLRIEGTELSELSYVVSAMNAEDTDSDEDEEESRGEWFEVNANSPSCIVVERTDESGEYPELTRAPDTVPVGGVDPREVSMEGAWAFEPTGGLRRIDRCDFED